MQIVPISYNKDTEMFFIPASTGDNLYEISKPAFCEKYFSIWSAENFTQSAKL